MASVSVYIQGNEELGKVFGDTRLMKTNVYTLPDSVNALSTAVHRSSGTSGVLVLNKGASYHGKTTKLASTLEKLALTKEPIVTYLGPDNDGIFLNMPAVETLHVAGQEPVAVPTRSGDDVPGADVFSSPTDTYVHAVQSVSSRSDVHAQLRQFVADGKIKEVKTDKLFVVVAPAPAQITPLPDYSTYMVASPVSDEFSGSPSTEVPPATSANGPIAYYDPAAEATEIIASSTGPAATMIQETQSQVQSSSSSQYQSTVTTSWWLWLIIVIILVVLLIVSVVLYYRR